MDDVVVPREEMRASVAKVGEGLQPRGASLVEQAEGGIAVTGGHEDPPAGQQCDRPQARVTLRGEGHHPHVSLPRSQDPLHQRGTGVTGVLGWMGADEAALLTDERSLDMDPGHRLLDLRIGVDAQGQSRGFLFESGDRIGDQGCQKLPTTSGPEGSTGRGQGARIEVGGGEVEAAEAVELQVEWQGGRGGGGEGWWH